MSRNIVFMYFVRSHMVHILVIGQVFNSLFFSVLGTMQIRSKFTVPVKPGPAIQIQEKAGNIMVAYQDR